MTYASFAFHCDEVVEGEDVEVRVDAAEDVVRDEDEETVVEREREDEFADVDVIPVLFFLATPAD